MIDKQLLTYIYTLSMGFLFKCIKYEITKNIEI